MWASDQTSSGFTVTSRRENQDDLVILPELFRRLADHLSLQPPDDVDLAGFGRVPRRPRHATALDTLRAARAGLTPSRGAAAARQGARLIAVGGVEPGRQAERRRAERRRRVEHDHAGFTALPEQRRWR